MVGKGVRGMEEGEVDEYDPWVDVTRESELGAL